MLVFAVISGDTIVFAVIICRWVNRNYKFLFCYFLLCALFFSCAISEVIHCWNLSSFWMNDFRLLFCIWNCFSIYYLTLSNQTNINFESKSWHIDHVEKGNSVFCGTVWNRPFAFIRFTCYWNRHDLQMC